MKNYHETEFAGKRDEESEAQFRGIQYGDPLTGVYLENYNAMMQVANTQVQAIVTSLSAGDQEPVEKLDTVEPVEPGKADSTESTESTDTKEDGVTEA